MLVLITYDVNTETTDGKNACVRLLKNVLTMEKEFKNSVFECVMDAATCRLVKEKLINIIDEKFDSIRFYYLGNNYKTKVEHYGIDNTFDVEGVLLF